MGKKQPSKQLDSPINGNYSSRYTVWRGFCGTGGLHGGRYSWVSNGIKVPLSA